MLLTATVVGLAGCSSSASPSGTTPGGAVPSVSSAPSAASPSATAAESSTTSAAPGQVTKVLTIIEENHSLTQAKDGMPYLYGLAQRFGYATHYTGVTHPSSPNYLAVAGGDTFGVRNDAEPAAHVIHGASVFGQALQAGRTAGVYEESMPGNCALTGDVDKGYAVKHNPWAYFVDERSDCQEHDRSDDSFLADVRANALPDAGLLIPDKCHDAHDIKLGCHLGGADRWLERRLPTVLASSDFTSGALAVVVTADEDDRHSENRVLTVVLHASLDGSHTVVSTPLNHYSLSAFYSHVVGAPPLRRAADAPDLAQAFALPMG